MDVQKIISEINALEPVSNIGEKLVALMADPDSSIKDLVNVISYDQSLTVNLLRICNSAYFGLSRRVSSVREAVTYLGLEKVACLVMIGNSAANFGQAQQGYDLKKGQLWRYSVSSAVIAQHLAEKCKFDDVSLVFTGALLKDIGKVILSHHVAPIFEKIAEKVSTEKMTFSAAERALLGIDHAELGALAVEKWRFSPDMADIIRNHHHPHRAGENRKAVYLVYLADCIAMMIGVGVGADGLAYKHYQDVVDALGFDEQDLLTAIAGFSDKMQEVEELVNLSGGLQ